VTSEREVAAIRELAASGALLEANDVACVQLLAGAPHIVGPYINVFNEGARDFLIDRGAIRIVVPVEMPATSIRIVAATAGRAGIEVQVFGRQPLSVACVTHFRLSPHNLDMVRVAELYRDVLDERRSSTDALQALRSMTADVPFVNGFLHGREGLRWV
jgi:hypothetical protein